jgi:hypothetical protein
MQGIYNYIPETNHMSRVYSVSASPRLLFIVRITLSSVLNSFVLLLIIITIIIITIISFMQGIHTYIPETNHVSRVYSVAAIPRILLMVYITLSAIFNSFVLLH